MMGHLRALWRKELRQQRWTLLGAASLLAFAGFGHSVALTKDPAATHHMLVVARTLVWFVPLLALAQAQATVVREYRAKTQLFVEALPLRRWELPLAKFTWGLLTQAALSLALWLVIIIQARETDLRFLAITSSRTFGYVLTSWSVAFGLALLGRMRWLAASTLFIFFFTLRLRGVEIGRWGPLALIDGLSLPYERRDFPVRAFLESGTLSSAALALAGWLAMFHEGSMAEVLARRASTGEKAGFWVVLFSQVTLATWLTRVEKREPFHFTSETLVAGSRWNTQVMYGLDSAEPRARSVLDMLDRLAAGLVTVLGVAEPPALRVSHNASLDGPRVRVASSALGAGVLLEANFGAEGFDLDELAATAAHQSFGELSAGRALFEPNHWFADGFSRYWAPRGAPGASDRHWLDTLVARRTLPLDATRVLEWERLCERIGEPAANSVGFTLVEVLERRHGQPAVLHMARTLLARATVRNGFDWLFASRADLPRLLEQSTGESWHDFLAAYGAELDRAAERLAAALGELPALRASLSVETTDVGGDVLYELSGAAPAAVRRCQLRHTQLPAYDLAVGSEGLKDHAIPWEPGQELAAGRLVGQYQSGQRLLAVIDCPLPGLAAAVRLEARRLEVP